MAIEELREGVYRILTPFDKTGTVFLYLVKGERVALIDTGASDSPHSVIKPALAELGLSWSDVELILTTHAHLDHSGGSMEVKRFSGAAIHVHADDVFMAESNEAQVEFHTAPLRLLDYPQEAIQDRVRHVLDNAGEPAGVDVRLSDGDKIDLGQGVALSVLHCPGHTPGHVAYYWEREGLLFTGDCVQGQGSRAGGYPYYFDAVAYRNSLAKLAVLDFRMLCLGHAFQGGTLVNEPVRRGEGAKDFMRVSLEVADSIHAAVAEAMRQHPGAGKREIARAAIDELVYVIPQLRLRSTGLPLMAGPALVAHMEAVAAGNYPA
jgi:glyoxylase-like metal-dependent hydrolase (beta-lactamase superfamily II)